MHSTPPFSEWVSVSHCKHTARSNNRPAPDRGHNCLGPNRPCAGSTYICIIHNPKNATLKASKFQNRIFEAFVINMLLVYASKQPYKFDKIVYIRDPVLGPRICPSSALKTLGPDIPKMGPILGLVGHVFRQVCWQRPPFCARKSRVGLQLSININSKLFI